MPKKKLTNAEKLAKRTEFANAHLRSIIQKRTSWKDEKKDLVQKYGKFGHAYGRVCYAKLNDRGTLVAKSSPGRPRKYDDSLVVDAVREARSSQNNRPHRLSARKMAATLAKAAVLKGETDSPSKDTVARTKKRLQFKRIKRRKKPLADAATRAKRLKFAQENDGFCFHRWMVLDEKWFTEDKRTNEEIEARHCSPLTDAQRFFCMAAETSTQLKKKMFLVGVTEGKKVGFYEVDCSDPANVLKKRDKDGKTVQARGMGAALFSKLAKNLHDDFRKIWPTGDVGVWMDLAQAHKGARDELQKWFKLGVIEQPPRSPDFNLLDAGLFPYMERCQQQAGSITYDEIRQSVKDAYDGLTDATVTKVCNAVRANFRIAIKKQGGNWYIEHRHKDRVRDEECCRCRATYTGDGESTLLLCDHRGCMWGIHRRCLRRGERAGKKFFCDSHRP